MIGCFKRLWNNGKGMRLWAAISLWKALRDIKNGWELHLNVDPLTTTNWASVSNPKMTWYWAEWVPNACDQTVHFSQSSIRIIPKMLIDLAASIPYSLSPVPFFLSLSKKSWGQIRQPVKFYYFIVSRVFILTSLQHNKPTMGNASKIHRLRLKSQLTDKIRLS